MVKPVILTNNQMAYTKYEAKYDTTYFPISYLDLLYQVRDKVHLGYSLLTHPLAGSLKPNQTPYRSVVLARGEKRVDMDSITLIENSIDAAVKFLQCRPTPVWNSKNLKDFQTVDLSILQNALKQMGSLILSKPAKEGTP